MWRNHCVIENAFNDYPGHVEQPGNDPQRKTHVRDRSFAAIEGSGHFLDLESRTAADGVHRARLAQLLPSARAAREPATAVEPITRLRFA
ncbi:hypothetical protein [Pseudomonas chlororaphis]|uniref:hypothetical protein n=1 Tax=Pseudomonas chlororaphis TaxID=587753 RepID=UPI0006A65BA5|nr:hypothetical protein [Pseudomonas chlororaphis]AZD01842.1 hypothetical protein C4K27_2648 [Pseudomonas chlororaphis subsp. chlororaphis]MBM0283030.1 hypothetical protein [Pseudomonas chlororaphis]MDO1507241.1 hypothetical protein [Pseudomonas chlororaphis]ORM45464.1 hypothetical protein B6D51_25820 [Pseudomonas chlororaphis subsp. chlororaphis]TWR98647.1 hypothetical protein FJD36_01400 [Pseudomonas chlororaphis subsp. chlororaphis]